MREIKYRVWSKKDSSFFETDLVFTRSGDFAEIHRIHNRFWMGGCFDYLDDNYVIQQYTGLKDKNGVEIYEGDILLDKNGAKYSVFWHDTDVEFSLSIMNEDEFDDFLISLCWSNVSKFHLEIVGNIFEGVDK